MADRRMVHAEFLPCDASMGRDPTHSKRDAMALCDISIELDGGQSAFSAGEPIAGRVRIHSHDEIACRRIVAHCGWRIRARTGAETGGTTDAELDGARTLSAGETAEYTFWFTAPDGPYSYAGRSLSLVWSVGARVEVESGHHPRADRVFTLQPGESGRRHAYQPNLAGVARLTHPEGSAAGISMLVRVIATIGFALLVAGGFLVVRAILDAGRTAIEELAFGLVMLAFGGLGVWQLVMARRSARLVAGTELTVGTPEVRAGELLRVSLDVPAIPGVRVRSASLHLLCDELLVGSEEGERAKRTAVRDTQVAGGGATEQGKGLRLQAVIRVPENAPLSVRARAVGVDWSVEARMNLPLAPDVRIRKVFVVRP